VEGGLGQEGHGKFIKELGFLPVYTARYLPALALQMQNRVVGSIQGYKVSLTCGKIPPCTAAGKDQYLHLLSGVSSAVC